MGPPSSRPGDARPPATDGPKIHPPQRVGQYRVVSKLGAGGMSEVFLAEDTELHRQVALKFLHLHAADEASRIRFRQEARAAAALNHPNIVTIYQILEHGEHLAIAMEYVEGRTLRSMIRERRLGVGEAVEITLQVCDGLAEAHRLGIVHRDVKPENVLIEGRGRVKVLDFGLAKWERSAQVTDGGRVMGTPAYMSPEQAWSGESVGPASDLFSLGVVLHEMLAGECPFQGSNPVQILKKILDSPPQPFPADGEVPPSLQRVVLRAMEKNPEDRYASAEELAQDLRAIQESLRLASSEADTAVKRGLRAVLPPSTVRPRRSPGRGWRVPGLLALLAVLSALSVAAWFFRSSRDSEKGPPAVTTIAILPFTVRGGEELRYLDHGLVELLSLKLDVAGSLRCVDPRALLSYTAQRQEEEPSLARDKEIARRFGARYVAQGSLVEVGEELHLEVVLYDVEDGGGPKAAAGSQGRPDDILSMLDDVAARLLGDLITGPGGALRRTAAATSDSLSAVKAYLRGEAHFRAGRHEEALGAFQEAVDEDPDFALAHYRLCAAADWVARAEISARAAAAATRLAHRLNAHERRLLEALVATRAGRAGDAERTYRAVLGTYKDDVEAWFRLGDVLFHYNPRRGRPAAEAAAAFERVVALEPEHVPALWHLVRIAAREASAARVERLTARIRQLQPSGDRLFEILTLEAFALGDASRRARALDALRDTRDLTLLITVWDLATFLPPGRDVLPAAALVSDPARSPEMRALGHAVTAHLHLAAGRWSDAGKALDRCAELDPLLAAEYRALFALHPLRSPGAGELVAARDALHRIGADAAVSNATPNLFLTVHDAVHVEILHYLRGRLSLRLGEAEEAARQAEALAALRPPAEESAALAVDLEKGLRARLALRESDPQTAIRVLEEAVATHVWYGWTTVSPFFSRSPQRFLLAETLAAAGRTDEALRLFGSFVEHSLFDLVFVALSHLRRAELHEDRGEKEPAARHYREFLRLFEDCDAEFEPWVERAARRLAVVEE